MMPMLAPDHGPVPDPGIAHLLMPKLLTGRTRLVARKRGSGIRATVLITIGFAFWGLVFGVLYRMLSYFKNVQEIGTLLAGKLLGLILVSFFGLLLLSSVITALSSFFLAKDLDGIVGAPVDWLHFYSAKLLETFVNSSWMVVLMAIPMFLAYGIAFQGGVGFGVYVTLLFVPFAVIPSVIGSALTLTLVNVFPARRTRDILSVIAVLTAGALVLFLRIIRPERLAQPEGFRSLMDFMGVLRAPSTPFMPSDWMQRATMRWLDLTGPDWLGMALLWTTAAALFVLGAALHRVWYDRGYSKAQESAHQRAGRNIVAKMIARALAPLGPARRELVMKELRLFFRDTTQWSQLILLSVLVAVYVFNIRYLPLRGDGVTFFLVNVVPFLNLALAGFVLASVAARFIFPAVSLEGRTLWLLRSSPLAMRDLLMVKYWVGTIPLLVLAVGVIAVTDYMLEVTAFMFIVSTGTIALMTFALSAMAIGFGTLFPQFETENAAQIPTSFGGLLYMMASIVLIGIVVVLEASPVYSYLLALSTNIPRDPRRMVVFFGLATVVCLGATTIPLRLARRRLEQVER
jgi:ABC-2 type transport system permease protein